MTEYVQPILVAMAVLLIPACTRFAMRAMNNKLDEGRVIAEANRENLKKAAAEEAAHVAEILEGHRKEFLGKLTAIEAQTTATNGKVAEHDKAITVLNARTDILLNLVTKGQPE